MGRLKIIFCLPGIVDHNGFMGPAPSNRPKYPLAYVDHDDTGLYRIELAMDSKGQLQGSIIPLTDIRQSCTLVPSRVKWDLTWNTGDSFFNNWQSTYSYPTIY